MKVLISIASLACLVGSVALITVRPAVAGAKAAQAATDVNVVNAPFVKISNIARVRPVREPVRRFTTIYFPTGAAQDSGTSSSYVPDGMQMVIEGINYSTSSTSLNRLLLYVSHESGTALSGYVPIAGLSGGYRVGYYPIKMRLSAGERLSVMGYRSSVSTSESVSVYYHGYLEPAP